MTEAQEYKTTRATIDPELGQQNPVIPAGLGWEMCGGTCYVMAGRLTLLWFWRRPRTMP